MSLKDVVSQLKKNWRIWLFSLVILQIIIFLIWAWWVNSYLNRIENNSAEAVKINKSFENLIRDLDDLFVPFPTNVTFLDQNGFLKIKDILFSLKTSVDKAIELSHQDVINIVDRVNLYVTIGVLLLSLIGVFLPIIVQYFGKEEMLERHEELKKKIAKEVKGFNKLVKKSTDKIKGETSIEIAGLKSDVSSSRNDLENIKKNAIYIPPLRLGYSLLRALDKDLIRWYATKSTETKKRFKEIFENVIADLKECKNNILSSDNHDLVRDSLRDFNYNLEQIMVIQPNSTRELLNIFTDLHKSIKKYINSNEKIESNEKHLDEVIEKFTNIVEAIDSKS